MKKSCRVGIFLSFLVLSSLNVLIDSPAWADSSSNDTIATAEPAQLGSTVNGSLSAVVPADPIDIYSVTIPSDGYFQFGVSPNSELDVEVFFIDADGITQLGYANDYNGNIGKGGKEGIVYRNLRAGKYYAVVKIPENSGNEMKGDYSITFNFAPVEEVDSESNDTFTQPAIMPLNGETKGHIGYVGGTFTDTRDYYIITLPKDGKLELTAYPDDTLNLALGLYDSVIANNLDWQDQQSKGVSEKLVYNNLRAGKYIILIYRSEGYGSYNLTSLFTEETIPETNEPNDTLVQAAEIPLQKSGDVKYQGVVQGRLGYYGNQYKDDNDYFKITTPGFGKITLTCEQKTGDKLNIGYVVYDQGLRFVDNTINNEYIRDKLPAGTYYFRLYQEGGFGGYTLTCTWEAQDVPEVFTGIAYDLSANGTVNNIQVNADNPEVWYRVNLPEDGQFTIKGSFKDTVRVYVNLYQADGNTFIQNMHFYFINDELSFSVPNLRKGIYLIQVSRIDGSAIGTLTTQFTPVTKLDNEPNDEYTSLTPVALNQSYVGHLGYSGNGWIDRIDLFLFTVPEDGEITLTTTSEKTIRLYTYLYNNDGNSYTYFGETHSYWTDIPQTFTKFNIGAGRYIVQVWHIEGYGSYTLDVKFTPNRSVAQQINGDDMSQPTPIKLGEGYVGTFGYEKNFFKSVVDYYKIEIPEDGKLLIYGQAEKTMRVYWNLYYSDAQTSVNNWSGIYSEAHSYWNTDLQKCGSFQLKAGTYYLRIYRVDGYGTYNFYTEFEPEQFKDASSNYIASQAQDLPLGAIAQGALGYGNLYNWDNVDWYRVSVPIKGKYKLTTQATHMIRCYFELYTQNMVNIIYQDHRYYTTDLGSAELDLEAGTYYIKVVRWDGTSTYNVRLGDIAGEVTGTLSGVVKSVNNLPLAEISVKIFNLEKKTEFDGSYQFLKLPPGTYEVNFSAGAKYYPESRIVAIKAGQTTQLNVTLYDANKTAPLDVVHFYGITGDQYVHFFWSPSVSPDVPDGGGYKLYIDSNPAIDLKNVLFTRMLGFENGRTFTCRLTVYDKYGNESQGKTILVTPTGTSPVVTPTPSNTPVQPPPATSTPTILGQPTPVYPTPTPTQPALQPTPTPTLPVIHPTPIPGEVKPTYIWEFDKATLAENGWKDIPGGFTGMNPGIILPMGFVSNVIPSSKDKMGLVFIVHTGQVAFIHTLNPVKTYGLPALIRITARANSSKASIAIAALRGNLVTAELVDGSIATHVPQSSEAFVDNERQITLVYEPDKGELLTPIIQVASLQQSVDSSDIMVYIDRMEIFLLDPNIPYMGNLFGSKP